jgi:hypothetical protein
MGASRDVAAGTATPSCAFHVSDRARGHNPTIDI